MAAPIKQFIRPGCLIEVGCLRRKRPSYRWVQGWQVFDSRTGWWSVEMRYRDALAAVRQIKVEKT